MCWFSHDLEPYAFKILSRRVLLTWLLFGSVSPDIFTKFFIESGWIPVFQHRHIGIGVTHTLFFGVVVAIIIYFLAKRKVGHDYAVRASTSFLIGQWSHVLLDSLDSVGLMIFFPFSEKFFALSFWSYAAQLGHWGDLYVFYHSIALFIETIVFVFVWLKAWRFLLPREFEKILSEERLDYIISVRNRGVLYTLYFYYMVASLRLPVWVFKVWFAYTPTDEALLLVFRNMFYQQLFTSQYVAYVSLLLMIGVMIYVCYRMVSESGGRAVLVLLSSQVVLFLIAMYVSNEPVMSSLSTITAVATAYMLYNSMTR